MAKKKQTEQKYMLVDNVGEITPNLSLQELTTKIDNCDFGGDSSNDLTVIKVGDGNLYDVVTSTRVQLVKR